MNVSFLLKKKFFSLRFLSQSLVFPIIRLVTILLNFLISCCV
jgi:hypothetical protein